MNIYSYTLLLTLLAVTNLHASDKYYGTYFKKPISIFEDNRFIAGPSPSKGRNIADTQIIYLSKEFPEELHHISNGFSSFFGGEVELNFSPKNNWFSFHTPVGYSCTSSIADKVQDFYPLVITRATSQHKYHPVYITPCNPNHGFKGFDDMCVPVDKHVIKFKFGDKKILSPTTIVKNGDLIAEWTNVTDKIPQALQPSAEMAPLFKYTYITKDYLNVFAYNCYQLFCKHHINTDGKGGGLPNPDVTLRNIMGRLLIKEIEYEKNNDGSQGEPYVIIRWGGNQPFVSVKDFVDPALDKQLDIHEQKFKVGDVITHNYQSYKIYKIVPETKLPIGTLVGYIEVPQLPIIEKP